MAKQRNTFAKRSRETEKKRKAEDKIERRRRRKDQPRLQEFSLRPGLADEPSSEAIAT